MYSSNGHHPEVRKMYYDTLNHQIQTKEGEAIKTRQSDQVAKIVHEACTWIYMDSYETSVFTFGP